jgi:hypothetical protein
MTRNILTVGDLHGRETWKEFVFGSIKKFEDWSLECASGEYVRPWEETLDMRFGDIDKIVFVGDYFDSFTVSNVTMKRNVEDLFLFKRCYPEKIELLWGNHDVHYWHREEQCSGFRGEMFYDFYEILYANKHLIKFAYQEGNALWTHAGVTENFYEKLMTEKHLEDLEEHKRWTAISENYSEKPKLDKTCIAKFLNQKWEEKWSPLFAAGKARGGFSPIPGPLWADKQELSYDMLSGIFQFVGHTPVEEVNGIYDDTHGVCFLDCLERGIFKAVVVVKLTENKYVDLQVVEKD